MPKVSIKTAKSNKTGKVYTFIEVAIGEYVGRLFPTPGEIAYIKLLKEQKAHEDFKESVEKDED